MRENQERLIEEFMANIYQLYAIYPPEKVLIYVKLFKAHFEHLKLQQNGWELVNWFRVSDCEEVKDDQGNLRSYFTN